MDHALRIWSFVINYSVLLFLGTISALLWANLAPESYQYLFHYVIIDHSWVGHLHIEVDGVAHRTLTLHYLVNDVFMPLFFFMAGKEIWEVIVLKSGSMRGRKAYTPLIATVGGMLGPIGVYIGLAYLMGPKVLETNLNGWAIPTATDIAFSLIVARLVFGSGHPAVQFLLLLAIADDAGGVLILAIFYPTTDINIFYLLAALIAIVITGTLFNLLPKLLDEKDEARMYFRFARNRLGLLPYMAVGCFSWYCFQESGIHPALGLLPIIPIIPHADNDLGIFAEKESERTDLLNTFEHRLKVPVQFIMFLFGLMNAGVVFSSVGNTTWLVLAGLLVGKPLGIFLFGWFAATVLGFGLPFRMKMRDLFVLGLLAAIGFTVALFVTSVAFPAGETQDQAKMGAVFSFAAAVIAIVVSKILKIERISTTIDDVNHNKH